MMKSNESFNTQAELYDEVRPSYPEEVINWIEEKAKLNTSHSLLEIAPGTGQATKKFGEKGYRIHCVELGDKLAELTRKNCSDMNVTVDVSSFETWVNESGTAYDMIYCATAFHWLDPKIKYKKCYDLLNEEGLLVLLWNTASDTKNEIEKQAYRLLFSGQPEKINSSLVEIDNMRREEIENSQYFTVEHALMHQWSMKQSREALIKGFYSQSSYIAMEEKAKLVLTDQLNELFLGLEDTVSTEFNTMVYVCKKV